MAGAGPAAAGVFAAMMTHVQDGLAVAFEHNVRACYSDGSKKKSDDGNELAAWGDFPRGFTFYVPAVRSFEKVAQDDLDYFVQLMLCWLPPSLQQGHQHPRDSSAIAYPALFKKLSRSPELDAARLQDIGDNVICLVVADILSQALRHLSSRDALSQRTAGLLGRICYAMMRTQSPRKLSSSVHSALRANLQEQYAVILGRLSTCWLGDLRRIFSELVRRETSSTDLAAIVRGSRFVILDIRRPGSSGDVDGWLTEHLQLMEQQRKPAVRVAQLEALEVMLLHMYFGDKASGNLDNVWIRVTQLYEFLVKWVKVDDLKSASLRTMASILVISNGPFFEKNYEAITQKFISNVAKDKRKETALFCLLRILRGPVPPPESGWRPQGAVVDERDGRVFGSVMRRSLQAAKMSKVLESIGRELFPNKKAASRVAEYIDYYVDIVVQMAAHSLDFVVRTTLHNLLQDRSPLEYHMIAIRALRIICDERTGFAHFAAGNPMNAATFVATMQGLPAKLAPVLFRVYQTCDKYAGLAAVGPTPRMYDFRPLVANYPPKRTEPLTKASHLDCLKDVVRCLPWIPTELIRQCEDPTKFFGHNVAHQDEELATICSFTLQRIIIFKPQFRATLVQGFLALLAAHRQHQSATSYAYLAQLCGLVSLWKDRIVAEPATALPATRSLPSDGWLLKVDPIALVFLCHNHIGVRRLALRLAASMRALELTAARANAGPAGPASPTRPHGATHLRLAEVIQGAEHKIAALARDRYMTYAAGGMKNLAQGNQHCVPSMQLADAMAATFPEMWTFFLSEIAYTLVGRNDCVQQLVILRHYLFPRIEFLNSVLPTQSQQIASDGTDPAINDVTAVDGSQAFLWRNFHIVLFSTSGIPPPPGASSGANILADPSLSTINNQLTSFLNSFWPHMLSDVQWVRDSTAFVCEASHWHHVPNFTKSLSGYLSSALKSRDKQARRVRIEAMRVFRAISSGRDFQKAVTNDRHSLVRSIILFLGDVEAMSRAASSGQSTGGGSLRQSSSSARVDRSSASVSRSGSFIMRSSSSSSGGGGSSSGSAPPSGLDAYAMQAAKSSAAQSVAQFGSALAEVQFYFDYAVCVSNLSLALFRPTDCTMRGPIRRTMLPSIEAAGSPWPTDARLRTYFTLRQWSGHGIDASVRSIVERNELARLVGKDARRNEYQRTVRLLHMAAHFGAVNLLGLNTVFARSPSSFENEDVDWLVEAERQGHRVLRPVLAFNFASLFDFFVDNSYSRSPQSMFFFHAICDMFLPYQQLPQAPSSDDPEAGFRYFLRLTTQLDAGDRLAVAPPSRQDLDFRERIVPRGGVLLNFALYHLRHPSLSVRLRAFQLIYRLCPTNLGTASDAEGEADFRTMLDNHREAFTSGLTSTLKSNAMTIASKCAERCRSFTYAVFEAAFDRLRYPIGQANTKWILEYLLPWCANVSLVGGRPKDAHVPCSLQNSPQFFVSSLLSLAVELARYSLVLEVAMVFERLASPQGTAEGVGEPPNNLTVLVDLVFEQACREPAYISVYKAILLRLYRLSPQSTLGPIVKHLTFSNLRDSASADEIVRAREMQASGQDPYEDPSLADYKDVFAANPDRDPFESTPAAGAAAEPTPGGSPQRSMQRRGSSGNLRSSSSRFLSSSSSSSGRAAASGGASSGAGGDSGKSAGSRRSGNRILAPRPKSATTISMLIDLLAEGFHPFLPYLHVILNYIVLHLDPHVASDDDALRKLLNVICTSLLVEYERSGGLEHEAQSRAASASAMMVSSMTSVDGEWSQSIDSPSNFVRSLANFLQGPTLFHFAWSDIPKTSSADTLDPSDNVYMRLFLRMDGVKFCSQVIELLKVVAPKAIRAWGEEVLRWAVGCKDMRRSIKAHAVYRFMLSPMSEGAILRLLRCLLSTLDVLEFANERLQEYKNVVNNKDVFEKALKEQITSDYSYAQAQSVIETLLKVVHVISANEEPFKSPSLFWTAVALLRSRMAAFEKLYNLGLQYVNLVLSHPRLFDQLSERLYSTFFWSYVGNFSPEFKGIQPLLFKGMLDADVAPRAAALLVDAAALPADVVDRSDGRFFMTVTALIPWLHHHLDRSRVAVQVASVVPDMNDLGVLSPRSRKARADNAGDAAQSSPAYLPVLSGADLGDVGAEMEPATLCTRLASIVRSVGAFGAASHDVSELMVGYADHRYVDDPDVFLQKMAEALGPLYLPAQADACSDFLNMMLKHGDPRFHSSCMIFVQYLLQLSIAGSFVDQFSDLVGTAATKINESRKQSEAASAVLSAVLRVRTSGSQGRAGGEHSSRRRGFTLVVESDESVTSLGFTRNAIRNIIQVQMGRFGNTPPVIDTVDAIALGVAPTVVDSAYARQSLLSLKIVDGRDYSDGCYLATAHEVLRKSAALQRFESSMNLISKDAAKDLRMESIDESVAKDWFTREDGVEEPMELPVYREPPPAADTAETALTPAPVGHSNVLSRSNHSLGATTATSSVSSLSSGGGSAFAGAGGGGGGGGKRNVEAVEPPLPFDPERPRLESVLATQQMFRAFRTFVETNFDTGELDFLLMVKDYARELDDTRAVFKAGLIIERFIAYNSMDALALRDQTRDSLIKNFKASVANPSPLLFAGALDEVMATLRHSILPSFIKSEDFRTTCAAL